MENNPDYTQLLHKARDAKRGGINSWRVESTGEKVSVALVLNRADWLASMDYTLAQAIQRSGSWLPWIPAVERALRDEE